jgi:hypothetical protein
MVNVDCIGRIPSPCIDISCVMIVRSPCPGLNALANHGFINHNGKDLTIPHLITGLSRGLNIGPDFTTVIGALGLLSSPDPLAGAFDLNDLDQHNFPIVCAFLVEDPWSWEKSNADEGIHTGARWQSLPSGRLLRK